ncbi:MAG: type II toxin-antitoxin system RelE family toxin [Candidatus Acidiferrales bacterium]
MNYTVFVGTAAQKELGDLPEDIRNRIETALQNLAAEPRPAGCKKLKESPFWRIRVGNYRALYLIEDAKKSISVIRVAHRSKAYR